MIFWLLACSSAAERYQEALTAPDFDRALSACDADSCRTDVIARFARFEACDRLKAPDECHFLHAEHLARAGALTEGFAICKTAGESAGACEEHLLGMLALVDNTLPEAEAALQAANPQMPSARAHFLRLWFRRRIEQGQPVGDEACTDAVCRGAARHVGKAAGVMP